MIPRVYESRLDTLIQPGQVLVIYGARQVGKTTLVQQYLARFSGRAFSGVGEDTAVREVLESGSLERLRSNFGGYELIAIDEAQYVDRIGLALKLIVDHLPAARVLATGSSSFELANQIGEPLTGRKRTITLYPVSVLELKAQLGAARVAPMLDDLLIYGSYPAVLSQPNVAERVRYLGELRDSYLYKDILQLEQIRNPRKLSDLLTLLAFQIGQEVSLRELGSSLGLSNQTVARYLDLLEKAFVLRNVRGLSRNLRKEVTKTSRYYFLDNGVRNAVINNFNPLARRNDAGQLWENFAVMERIKRQHYLEVPCNYYFWRTYDQQEIDLVEEREGKLFGFEMKRSGKGARPPRDWSAAYPGAEFQAITPENFLELVT